MIAKLLLRIEIFTSRICRRALKVARFLYFIRMGLENQYPICCILHYAIDVMQHRRPALLRGGIQAGPDSTYVPCRFHKGRHPEWAAYGEEHIYGQLRLFERHPR